MSTVEPPLPPDVDLRDFPFLPLDVRRLMTSETWVLGRAEEKVAALNLWMESWHQVPAGSLPNDERMLAHLSQAGATWKRVRAHALRGWVLCSDGRLYHHVVVEKAAEAWERKRRQRERGKRGNAVRWGSREPSSGDPLAIAQGSHKDPPAILEGSQGTGTGIENPPLPPRGGERDSAAPGSERPPPPPDPPAVSAAVVLSIEARRLGLATQGSDPRLIALAEQGVKPATLAAAIEEARRIKGGEVPSLGYVVRVLESWAMSASKIAANGAAQPAKGGGVIALPSAATADEAMLRRISEANGGLSVERLPDGRMRCGVRYYRPNGERELAI